MAALKATFRSPKGYLALTMRRRSSRPALAIIRFVPTNAADQCDSLDCKWRIAFFSAPSLESLRISAFLEAELERATNVAIANTQQ